ncbi:MAG: hypothetical protein HQ513_07675 [Rhodospirillales bacterium]|nr:hypothetical protein [Rhodospirillales bacterium]
MVNLDHKEVEMDSVIFAAMYFTGEIFNKSVEGIGFSVFREQLGKPAHSLLATGGRHSHHRCRVLRNRLNWQNFPSDQWLAESRWRGV